MQMQVEVRVEKTSQPSVGSGHSFFLVLGFALASCIVLPRILEVLAAHLIFIVVFRLKVSKNLAIRIGFAVFTFYI